MQVNVPGHKRATGKTERGQSSANAVGWPRFFHTIRNGGGSILSDFEIIQHKFPNEDIVIYPISDVHLGAAEHLENEWNTFCKEILNQPNAYITLGGDLINNGTKNSVSNI